MENVKINGYLAGVVSSIISIIVIIFVFNNNNWDISGQILLVFGLAFGFLGVGSIFKPDSIGQITLQLLQNIAKNTEEQDKQHSNKEQKVDQIIHNYGTMSNVVGSKNSVKTNTSKKSSKSR